MKSFWSALTLMLIVGGVALSGCGPRLKTTPEHQPAADALSSGNFREVSDEIFLFSMGAAEDVLEKCSPKVDPKITTELVPFIVAGVSQGATGNKYRFGEDLTELSDAMRDQAKSQGAFFAGVIAARSLKCAEPEVSQIVKNAHKLAMKMKGGADGMKSEFVRSCARYHGAETCSCVAMAGLAADTNVFQKTYSKELVYEMMQRNPMNGLQFTLGCGLTRY